MACESFLTPSLLQVVNRLVAIDKSANDKLLQY